MNTEKPTGPIQRSHVCVVCRKKKALHKNLVRMKWYCADCLELMHHVRQRT